MTKMLWCNVAVKPHFSWPNVSIALPFEAKSIILSPPTDTLVCRAALFDPQGTTFEHGGTVLSRFLSRLAWSRNGGVVEFFHAGTNNPNEPGRLGQGTYSRSGWSLVDPPQYLYLPLPKDQDAELALALFREGLSVNSPPFGFLSLFKILNIRHSSGSAQERWINDHLANICFQPAVARLREIQAKHSDVGHYMYVQGRCAVAHASSSPLVNPDNYSDRRRLESDLPLMRELATLFIERELGVLSESSFYKHVGPTENTSELLIKGPIVDGRVTYVPYSSDA